MVLIFFLAVLVPIMFMSSLFEDFTPVILIGTVIFGVWGVVSIILMLKNRLVLLKYNEKEIYIRDVNVAYSPAVVSFLMNHKIETKKDLPATLLNLCTDGVLSIKKQNDKKQIEIIDLGNKEKVEKLSEDEKYAYHMFITGVTNAKINNWKNKVKNEYKKYHFSKEHKGNLANYILLLYFIFIIGISFFSNYFNQAGDFLNAIIIKIMIIIFFSAWEVSLFSSLKKIVKTILQKKIVYNDTEFIDTYTKKGAIEYTRWKKFKKFIEEFTLISQKDYQSIAILGKYLSYSIALGINQNCDKELYDLIQKNYEFDFKSLEDLQKIKIK